jgi:hypothetical protein
MNQNEKKTVVRPFGISMLEAQKSPRLKTGVSAGLGVGKIHSDDIRAWSLDDGSSGLSNLT